MALISAISEDAVGAGACNCANLSLPLSSVSLCLGLPALASFFRHSSPNELSRGTAGQQDSWQRERKREGAGSRGQHQEQRDRGVVRPCGAIKCHQLCHDFCLLTWLPWYLHPIPYRLRSTGCFYSCPGVGVTLPPHLLQVGFAILRIVNSENLTLNVKCCSLFGLLLTLVQSKGSGRRVGEESW